LPRYHKIEGFNTAISICISQDEKLSTSGHVENGYGTGKNQSRTKLMRGLKQVVGKERKL
jgi:hypothetical protein